MNRPTSCDDYRGRGQRVFPRNDTCALTNRSLNFLALTFLACSLLFGSGAEADQTEIFTGPIVQRSDIAKDLREYLASIAPTAVVATHPTLGPKTSDARGDPVLELRNYIQLVSAEEPVSALNEDNQASSAVPVSVPSLTQNLPQAWTRVAEADNI